MPTRAPARFSVPDARVSGVRSTPRSNHGFAPAGIVHLVVEIPDVGELGDQVLIAPLDPVVHHVGDATVQPGVESVDPGVRAGEVGQIAACGDPVSDARLLPRMAAET